MTTALIILSAWTLISIPLAILAGHRLHEIGKDYEDKQ